MNYSINRKQMIIAREKQRGYIYFAEYLEKYGLDEPLWEDSLIGAEDLDARNELAKRCLEAGKTATELGIVEKPREGVIR